MTRVRTAGWIVMSALAALIGLYAVSIFLVPASRNPFVGNLLTNHPHAAPVHFVGGAIALVTGALQLKSSLRRRFLSLHRWMGRLYVVAVSSSSLAGLALARDSSGGLIAHLGFGALAAGWFATTFLAYRYIRARNVETHRRWIVRSYALTFAAVTLRLYLPASAVLGISMDVAYPVVAWLCWAPNLFAAEWFIGWPPVPPRRRPHPREGLRVPRSSSAWSSALDRARRDRGRVGNHSAPRRTRPT